jgi:hypothetical protein
MTEVRTAHKIRVRKLKERAHLGGPVLGGQMLLKWRAYVKEIGREVRTDWCGSEQGP